MFYKFYQPREVGVDFETSCRRKNVRFQLRGDKEMFIIFQDANDSRRKVLIDRIYRVTTAAALPVSTFLSL